MFIPKEFEFKDREEIIAFIRRYSFGVIVTTVDDVPVATHLPFHILIRDEKIVLTAHMAKANRQWKGIEEKPVLVIFSQPHAYISPTHYENPQSVPTWNYIAVHTTGKCTLVSDADKGMEILEQMILQSEPDYKQQWDGLSQEYRVNMYQGIVPFEIEVTDIKAAAKLSQNKTESERQQIITTLAQSKESTENDIADFMKKGCPY